MPYLKTLRKTADEPFMPGMPEEEEVAVEVDTDVPAGAGADVPAPSAATPTTPAPKSSTSYQQRQADFESKLPKAELPRMFQNMEALNATQLMENAARQGASEPIKALREHAKAAKLITDEDSILPTTLAAKPENIVTSVVSGPLAYITDPLVNKAARILRGDTYMKDDEVAPAISNYLAGESPDFGSERQQRFAELLASPAVDVTKVRKPALEQETADGRDFQDVLSSQSRVRTYRDVATDVFASALKQQYIDQALAAGQTRKEGADEYRKDLTEYGAVVATEKLPNPTIRDVEALLAQNYGVRMMGKEAGGVNLLLNAATTAGTKALAQAEGLSSEVVDLPVFGEMDVPGLGAARDILDYGRDRGPNYRRIEGVAKEVQETVPQEAIVALIAEGSYDPNLVGVSYEDQRPAQLTTVQPAAEGVDAEERAANELFTGYLGIPARITAGIRTAEGNMPRAIAFNLDEAIEGDETLDDTPLSPERVKRINDALVAAGIAPYRPGENRPVYGPAATRIKDVVLSVDPAAALRGTAFGRFQVLGMKGAGSALELVRSQQPDLSEAEAALAFFRTFDERPDDISELLYVNWWQNNPAALELVNSDNFSPEALAEIYHGAAYERNEKGERVPVKWVRNFTDGFRAYSGPEQPAPEQESVDVEAEVEELGDTLAPTTFAENEESARFANTALGRAMRGKLFSAAGQLATSLFSGDYLEEAVGVSLSGETDKERRERLVEEQSPLKLTEVRQEAFDFRAFAETQYAPTKGTVAYVVATAAADQAITETPEYAERILSMQSLGMGMGFEAVVRDIKQNRLNEMGKDGLKDLTAEEIARVEAEATVAAIEVVTSFQTKGLWHTPVILDMQRLDALGKDYVPPTFGRLFDAMSPKIELLGRNGNEVIFRQEGGAMTLFNALDSVPIIGQSWNMGAAEGLMRHFGFFAPPRKYTDEVTSHVDSAATASNMGFFSALHEGGIRGVSTQTNLVEVGMRFSSYLTDTALETEVGEDALKVALSKGMLPIPVGVTGEDKQLVAARDLMRGYAMLPGMAVGLFGAVLHPDLLGGTVSAVRGGRRAFQSYRALPVGRLALTDPFAIPAVQLRRDGKLVSLVDRRTELLSEGDRQVEVTEALQELFAEGVENTATTLNTAALFEAARRVSAGDPGDLDDIAASLAKALSDLGEADKLDAARRKGSPLVARRLDIAAGETIASERAAFEAVVDATDEVLEAASARGSMGAAAALDAELSALVASVVEKAIERGAAGDAAQQAKAAQLTALKNELAVGDRLTLSPGALDKAGAEETSAKASFDTQRKVLLLAGALELIGNVDESPEMLRQILRKRLSTDRVTLGRSPVSDLIEGAESIKLVSFDDAGKVLPDSAIELFGPIDDAGFAALTAKTQEALTKQREKLKTATTDKQRAAIGKSIARLEASLTERTDKLEALRGFHSRVLQAFEDGTVYDDAVRTALREDARDMEIVFEYPQLFSNLGPSGRGDRYQKALLQAFDVIDTVNAAQTPRMLLDRGMSAVLAASMARGRAKQNLALAMVSVADEGTAAAQEAAKRSFLTSPRTHRRQRVVAALQTGTREGLLNLVHNTPFVGNRILRRLTPEDAARLESRRAYASVEDALTRQIQADGSDIDGFVAQAQIQVQERIKSRIASIEAAAGDGEPPEVLTQLRATLADVESPDFRVGLVEEINRMVGEIKAGKRVDEVEPLRLPVAVDVRSLMNGQNDYVVTNATQRFVKDSGFMRAYGFAGEEERQSAKLSRRTRTRKRALRGAQEKRSVEIVLDQIARFAQGVNPSDSADVVNSKVAEFYERVRQVRRVGGRKALAEAVENQRNTFMELVADRVEKRTGRPYQEVIDDLQPDKYVPGSDPTADLREDDLVYIEGAEGARVAAGRLVFADVDEQTALVTPQRQGDLPVGSDESYALSDIYVMSKDQRELQQVVLTAQFDTLEETLPLMSGPEALAVFEQSKEQMEALLASARRADAAPVDRSEMSFFQDEVAPAAAKPPKPSPSELRRAFAEVKRARPSRFEKGANSNSVWFTAKAVVEGEVVPVVVNVAGNPKKVAEESEFFNVGVFYGLSIDEVRRLQEESAAAGYRGDAFERLNAARFEHPSGDPSFFEDLMEFRRTRTEVKKLLVELFGKTNFKKPTTGPTDFTINLDGAAAKAPDDKYVLKAREMFDEGKSPNAVYEVHSALRKNVGPEAAEAFYDEYQSLRNARLQARLRADEAKAAAEEAKVKLATEPLKLASPKLPRSIKLPGGSPNQRQLNKQVTAAYDEYIPAGGVDRRLTPGVVDIEKASKSLDPAAEDFDLDADKRYSTVEITLPLAAPVTNHGRKYDKVTFVVPFESEDQARIAAVTYGFTPTFTDSVVPPREGRGSKRLRERSEGVTESGPDESYTISHTNMSLRELLDRNSDYFYEDSEKTLTVPLNFMPAFRSINDELLRYLSADIYPGLNPFRGERAPQSVEDLVRSNLPAMLSEIVISRQSIANITDVADYARSTPTGRVVRKQVEALAEPAAAKAPETAAAKVPEPSPPDLSAAFAEVKKARPSGFKKTDNSAIVSFTTKAVVKGKVEPVVVILTGSVSDIRDFGPYANVYRGQDADEVVRLAAASVAANYRGEAAEKLAALAVDAEPAASDFHQLVESAATRSAARRMLVEVFGETNFEVSPWRVADRAAPEPVAAKAPETPEAPEAPAPEAPAPAPEAPEAPEAAPKPTAPTAAIPEAAAPGAIRGEQQPQPPEPPAPVAAEAAPVAAKAAEAAPEVKADAAKVEEALSEAKVGAKSGKTAEAVKVEPFKLADVSIDEFLSSEIAEVFDIKSAEDLFSRIGFKDPAAEINLLSKVDPELLTTSTPVQLFSKTGKPKFDGPARIESIDADAGTVKLQGVKKPVKIGQLYSVNPAVERFVVQERYVEMTEDLLAKELENRGLRAFSDPPEVAPLPVEDRIAALVEFDMTSNARAAAAAEAKTAAREEAKAVAKEERAALVESAFQPVVKVSFPRGDRAQEVLEDGRVQTTAEAVAHVPVVYENRALFTGPVVKSQPVAVTVVRRRAAVREEVDKTFKKLRMQYQRAARLIGEDEELIQEALDKRKVFKKGDKKIRTVMKQNIALSEKVEAAIARKQKTLRTLSDGEQKVALSDEIRTLKAANARLRSGTEPGYVGQKFSSPVAGERSYNKLNTLLAKVNAKLKQPRKGEGAVGLEFLDVKDSLKPDVREVVFKYLRGLKDESITAGLAGLRSVAPESMKTETLRQIESLLVDVGVLRRADVGVQVVPATASEARKALSEIFAELGDEATMLGRIDLSRRVSQTLAEALTLPTKADLDDDVTQFLATLQKVAPQEYKALREGALLDSADSLLSEIAYEQKRLDALVRAQARAKTPKARDIHAAAIENVKRRMAAIEALMDASAPGEAAEELVGRVRGVAKVQEKVAEAAAEPVKTVAQSRREVREAARAARKAAKEAQAANIEQMPKGMVRFLLDSTAILYAFKRADVSTGLHEMAHVLRRSLSDTQMERPLKWVNEQLSKRGMEEVSLVEVNGVFRLQTESKSLDSVVEAEELFARAFERYLREGDTPNTVLQQAFAMMKDLLSRIYAAVTGSGIDVDISPEMYTFFDEVFGATTDVTATQIADIQRRLDASQETRSPVNVGGRIIEQAFTPRNAMDVIRQRQRSLQDYRARGFGYNIPFVNRMIDRVEMGEDVDGLTVGPGAQASDLSGPATRRLLTNKQLAELSDGTRSERALRVLDDAAVTLGSATYGLLGSVITYGGDPMRLYRQVTPEMRAQMLGFGREAEEFYSELSMFVIDAGRVKPADRARALRRLIRYMRGQSTQLTTGAVRGQYARQNFVDTEDAIFMHLRDRLSKLADDSQDILVEDTQRVLATLGGQRDADLEGLGDFQGALSGFWKQAALRRGAEKRINQDGMLLLSDEVSASIEEIGSEVTRTTTKAQREQSDEVSDYFLKNVYKALTGLDIPAGRTPVKEEGRQLAALLMFHSSSAPMRVKHTLKNGKTVDVFLTPEDILDPNAQYGFNGLMFGAELERTMEDGTVVNRFLPGLLDREAFKTLTDKQRMTSLLMMAQSGYVAGVYDDMRKIGFGISATDYRSYLNYVGGNADLLLPEQIERAKAIERRFGFTSFTLAPTSDKRMYIPTATKASVTAALNLGARQAGVAGEGNRDFNLMSTAYSYIMQVLIFGGVVQRQSFKLNSNVDLGLQMGLVAGGAAGVAAASRAAALTALTAVEGERVAEVAEGIVTAGLRVTPGSVAEKLGSPEMLKSGLRSLAVKNTDKVVNDVTNFLGISKYRVEVAPILENRDDMFAIGGRIYRARDLRRTFTRAGMYSNAYKDMKETYSAYRRRDGGAPPAAMAASVEAEAKLSKANRKFVDTATEAVREARADAPNAVRRFGSAAFEHGLESADAWSDLERTGAAVTLMEMGYAPQDAARVVVDAVYDYRGSMTDSDRHWIRRLLMPFFAFRKNALAQATNLFASPEGAFRTIALFKALRFGAEGMTEVLYENILQPYDVNVSAMPIYIRNNYYATRVFLEYGLGDNPDPETIEVYRSILPEEDAGISDEELLDYSFNGWSIREGYGGYRNVPETARVAMRALIAARSNAGIRTGGDIKLLNEFMASQKIRQAYIEQGATMAARASSGDYGLPAWAARRAHIQVPIPILDENIKELLRKQREALRNGETPADVVGDSLYFVLPDNFIQSAIDHAGAVFAATVVSWKMVGDGLDVAQGKRNLSEVAKINTQMMLNAIEPTLDVKGAGSPALQFAVNLAGQASGAQAVKKKYVSPWAARIIEGSLGTGLPHDGDRARNPFAYAVGQAVSGGAKVLTSEEGLPGIRPQMYSRPVRVVVEDAEGRRAGDEGFDTTTASRKVVPVETKVPEYVVEGEESLAYRPYLTGLPAVMYPYTPLGMFEREYRNRFGDTPLEEAMEDSEAWSNFVLETVADIAKTSGVRVEVSDPQRAAAIDRPRINR